MTIPERRAPDISLLLEEKVSPQATDEVSGHVSETKFLTSPSHAYTEAGEKQGGGLAGFACKFRKAAHSVITGGRTGFDGGPEAGIASECAQHSQNGHL